MIILILIPPSFFDLHSQGQWTLMFPGVNSRDYAQYLQVANGIIPQNVYTTWQIWQRASAIQYLDKDTPQQSFQEGETINDIPSGASGVILTDDGITIKFQDLMTGTWNAGDTFIGSLSGANGLVEGYTPGAAVLPPNAALEGSGAIPQHAWITDALGTDLGAIMFCPNSYTIGLSGLGGFLNPDYQGVGDYSDVAGYTLFDRTDANAGVWQAALETSLVNGNVVIWNGQHYIVSNSTAFDGMDPSINTSAYSLIAKTAGANYGYIEEWDIIEYDFANNWLQYRADKRGNEFKYSELTDNYFGYGVSAITLFQWGNDNCYDNKIEEGVIAQINSLGIIRSNIVAPWARIDMNTLYGGGGFFSRIEANTFLPESSLRNKTFLGDAPTSFINNIVGMSIDQAETYIVSIVGKRVESGFSNFEATIDITHMSTGTLTIPVTSNYCGIINLTGASQNFSEINGFPTLFPYTLYPLEGAGGITVTLTGTAIASIAANDIALPTGSTVADGTHYGWIKLQADPYGTFSLQIDAGTYA